MGRYIASRVLHAVIVVWAAYTVAFLLLFALPSDPISLMLEKRAGESSAATLDPAVIAQLSEEYGFDRPLPAQYVTRLWDAIRGDFGTSVQNGRSVVEYVAANTPNTLLLAGSALVLAVVGGITLAVIATYTRQRWLRGFLVALPPLGLAIPPFWVGLLLLQLFSFRIPLFPAVGDGSLQGLVLPAITLSLPSAAAFAQVLIRSIQETQLLGYVPTAQAKGLSRSRVHLHHVVRNSIIPLLTMIGITVGGLLAGSVVTETVFSMKGIGRITQEAVDLQDLPVVQGIVVLSAIIYAAVNLVVDLVYPIVDPRISIYTKRAPALKPSEVAA